MRAGLWEDDEDGSGEGVRDKLDPTVILEREARLRKISAFSDVSRDLNPEAWGDCVQVPPDSENIEEFTADDTGDISRSPSRMSTAPTTDAQEVPREVLEEVQKLRMRISELEEHIRRNDVAKLKASLQASSLAVPPSLKIAESAAAGLLPHDRLDSLSTQDPWSPTRASDRTRVTLSSSMSSCDSPKGLPFVFPTHRGHHSSRSSYGHQALSPPQCNLSPLATPTRLSLRNSLRKVPGFIVQHQSMRAQLATSRHPHNDVHQALPITPSMPSTVPCAMMSPTSSIQVPVATSAVGPRRSERAASPIRHQPPTPTTVARSSAPLPRSWNEAVSPVASFVANAPLCRHSPVALSPQSVHRSTMMMSSASPQSVHRPVA